MNTENYTEELNKQIEEFMSAKEILLFGTMIMGRIAQRAAEYLSIRIIAFCDNDEQKQGKAIDGIPVLSADEFFHKEKKLPVYICSFNKKNIQDISNQLHNAGFQNVRSFEPILYVYRIQMKKNPIAPNAFADTMIALYHRDDRLTLRNLGISITQKCTLKCEHCGALIPRYRQPVHYDKREIKDSLKKICEAVDAIESLGLYGGEPFLHPELAELCEYAAGFGKIKDVCIITNGTIVPKQAVLERLAAIGIPVTISVYGSLSFNADKLAEKLESVKLPYERLGQEQEWFECLRPYKHNRSFEENKNYYDNCFSAKKCPVIQEGRLYVCGYSGSCAATGYVIPNDRDSVNLLDSGKDPHQIRSEINRLFHQRPYVETCDYCSMCEGKTVERAKQIHGNEFAGHSSVMSQ